MCALCRDVLGLILLIERLSFLLMILLLLLIRLLLLILLLLLFLFCLTFSDFIFI